MSRSPRSTVVRLDGAAEKRVMRCGGRAARVPHPVPDCALAEHSATPTFAGPLLHMSMFNTCNTNLQLAMIAELEGLRWSAAPPPPPPPTAACNQFVDLERKKQWLVMVMLGQVRPSHLDPWSLHGVHQRVATPVLSTDVFTRSAKKAANLSTPLCKSPVNTMIFGCAKPFSPGWSVGREPWPDVF